MIPPPPTTTPAEGTREPVTVVVGADGDAALAAPAYARIREHGPLVALGEDEALTLARHRDIPVVLIDPGVRDPVAIARHLARLSSAVEIAILADSRAYGGLQERLRRSPIPGGRATLYALDRPDLDTALAAVVDRARRRARFRCTIDVVNRQLASPQPQPVRPTIAVDHLLAGILTGAREPIVAVDAGGIVVVWNGAAERVLGVRAADAYGKPLREALTRLEPSDALLRLVDVGMGGELTCAIAGGPTLQATVNPLREAGGGAAIMFSDITDRIRAELELRRTAEELARSNKDLEQFAYIAAHDLQEPLRGISMFTDLLGNRPALQQDEVAARQLAKIAASAGRMRDLIQAVLGFSTIGREAIAAEPIALRDLVAEACENLASAIQHGQALITCATTATIAGDRPLLRQVLQNLIANALKFQPPDRRPEIRIDAAREVAMIRVSVTDNGIGIRPEHVAKLFRVFQRLHGRDEYPGTGIGLATCRRIIEQHGGRIWVDSVFGRGSTFSFTVPAAKG